MARFCSEYCDRFDKCYELGILDYMIILPLHPSEQDKDWCESFVEDCEE